MTLVKWKGAVRQPDGRQIPDESTRGAFDELVVLAPSHLLAGIVGALDKPTEAKLIGTLEKDLVKVPDHALWANLKQGVPPVQRP